MIRESNEGITLIALVVTIVVLIILAGISINLVLGQNGIITRAQESRENYKIAELLEMLNLEKGYIAIDKQGIVTVNDYISYIEQKGIIVGAENEILGSDSVNITVDDGYIFLVEK